MYRNYNNQNWTKMTVTEVSTVVSPTVEPIDLQEAKNWLRIDNNDDDDRITSLIVAARRRAETHIKRDIVGKNRNVFWTVLNEDVNLPYTVDAISTITVDGAELTTDGYELLGTGNAILRLNNYPAEKVEVTYTTSDYNNEEITNGILMCLEEMYYGNKTQWKMLLGSFRTFAHYGVK